MSDRITFDMDLNKNHKQIGRNKIINMPFIKTVHLDVLKIIIITTIVINCTAEDTEFQIEEDEKQCHCLNGGTCSSTDKYIACECPSGYIGSTCETQATLISKTDQQYTLNQNYSYFYFEPKQINYYQIALKICLPEQDINKLTNLVFLQVERSSGKLKLEPSIYQTSPMTFQGKQSRCQTFYTHFIPIRKKLNQQFQKIIFGVAIKNNSDTTANRWVSFLKRTAQNPQQSLRNSQVLLQQINEDLLSQQNEVQIQHQKITISCTYELYLVENYWGTFIIIMSGVTLFVSTGAFLYTLRNKYSYTLSNEDILRMYAISHEQFMTQRSLKNDLSHFSFMMPIMSYQLVVEKTRKKKVYNQGRKDSKKNKKINKIYCSLDKNQNNTSQQEQKQDTEAFYQADELVNIVQTQKRDQIIDQEIENTCTICLLNFESLQKVRQTPCGHIFHVDCIDNWCENTLNCPVCRRDLQHTRRKIRRCSVLRLRG